MPEYEKNCLAEYANAVEDKYLFLNPNESSLNSLLAGIVSLVLKLKNKKILRKKLLL